MNVNATTGSVNNSASANKGFSGLASGVDTDQMVEAMLQNTQSKIDKQSGLRQQTLWRQEIYRQLISKINSFQTKFFSATTSTNLTSQSFFNLMTAATSATSFGVTATSAAAIGTSKVRVQQLATSAKLTSGSAVSGVLAGKVDTARLEEAVEANKTAQRTVGFEIDGQSVSVDLKSAFVNADQSYTDGAGRQDEIVRLLDEALADFGVTASVQDGVLTLTADGEQTIKVGGSSSKLGLQALGLTAGRSSTVTAGKASLSGTLNTKNEFYLDVSLDDNKKTLALELDAMLDIDGRISLSKVGEELTAKLNRAHGAGQVTVELNAADGSLNLNTGEGRKVLVAGDKDALDAFGFLNGQSNRIGMGGNLSQLYFATPLQGERFAFEINGQSFTFDSSANMTEIMNKINTSDAGVRVVYRALEDKFTLEAADSGAGFDITMSQTEGNLLNAMFGSGYEINGEFHPILSGTKVTSSALNKAVITGGAGLDPNQILDETTFKITIDGTEHSFSLPLRTEEMDGEQVDKPYTLAEAIDLINHQMAEMLGHDELTITLGAEGQVALHNQGGHTLALSAEDNAFGELTGLSGLTSAVDENTTLGELGIQSLGQGTHDLTKLVELKNIDYPKGTLSFSHGRIIFTAKDGVTGEVDFGEEAAAGIDRLFGSPTLTVGQSQGGQAVYTSGQNAIVEIDDVITERNANSFSINGLNFNLKAETPEGTYETIEVSRGTDQIIEGVKSFIADYNSLIEELNGLIREEASYKKYPPLTEAQKKEMTEREIELWEEKSKEGLLRGDSAISTFLQSMRTALYDRPTGGLYAIYDIGIETSSNWADFGKLILSEDGEARLRQAIESNPDQVQRLFADPTEGVATRLNNILKATANTSTGSPGTLVQIAGVKGKATDANNELAARLKAIDDKIAALKASYETEKNRYWRQFNAMEAAIANLSAQSSWLTQQLFQ
jgi:flagellar hook-associated protein 2